VEIPEGPRGPKRFEAKRKWRDSFPTQKELCVVPGGGGLVLVRVTKGAKESFPLATKFGGLGGGGLFQGRGLIFSPKDLWLQFYNRKGKIPRYDHKEKGETAAQKQLFPRTKRPPGNPVGFFCWKKPKWGKNKKKNLNPHWEK